MYTKSKVGPNTTTLTSTDDPKPPVKQTEYFHQTSTVENPTESNANQNPNFIKSTRTTISHVDRNKASEESSGSNQVWIKSATSKAHTEDNAPSNRVISGQRQVQSLHPQKSTSDEQVIETTSDEKTYVRIKKSYIAKIPSYNPKEVVDSSNVVHSKLDTPKPSQEQKPSFVSNSIAQAETTEPSKKDINSFSQKSANLKNTPSDDVIPVKKGFGAIIARTVERFSKKDTSPEYGQVLDKENPNSGKVASHIPEFTLTPDAVTNTINTFKQQRDELLADNEQTIKVLTQNTQKFLDAQAFSITDLTSLIDAAQDSEQVESGKDEDKEFIQNQLQQKQAKIAAYKANIIQKLTTELSKNLKPEVIKAFTDKISASLDLYQKNRSTCMIFDKLIKHAEKRLESATIANKTEVEFESGNISSTRVPLEKYLHTKFAQVNNNANPRITETLYPETCKMYIFLKMIRFGADKQFALYINKLTPEELELAAFVLFTNETYAKTKGEDYKDNNFTGQFRKLLAQAYRPNEDVTKPCKTLYIPENGEENPKNFDLTKKHTRLELTDEEKKLFADLNSDKFDPSTGLGKIIYTIGPDRAPHFNMLNPFLCFLLLTYTERPFVSTEENNLRQELSQINLFNPIHIDIYEMYINKKSEFDKLFNKLLSAAGTLLISEFDGDDCRNYVSGA